MIFSESNPYTQPIVGAEKAKTFIDGLVDGGKAEFDVIEFVYDELDDLIEEGDIETINEILRSIPVDQVNVSVLLSILTITGGAKVKHKLVWRPNFYDQVEQHLREKGYNNVSIEQNLYGLK